MRILCVIDSIGSGGAQRQLVELASSFREIGHDLTFLTYHHSDYYLESLENAGIKYVCIEESSYLKRMLKMRSFIRRGNFNSVLSFLEASNFICEMAGLPWRKWKLVVGERSANPAILKSRKLKFYRWMHFFADYIVANSHENIRMVRSINPLLSKSKCKVIYNMIDLERWIPSDTYVPLKDGKLKIVIASSHQKVKNLHALIEGINGLDDDEKQMLVVEWYGDHGFDSSFDDGKNLIEKYKLTSIFKFYSATLQINEKMQSADVVALFSHHEGLPNAICEGMATGKPIIATKVSDLPKLLANQNGILCDSKDFASITIALKTFLNYNNEELLLMGNNSRNLSKKLFAKSKITTAYKELLIDNN